MTQSVTLMRRKSRQTGKPNHMARYAYEMPFKSSFGLMRQGKFALRCGIGDGEKSISCRSQNALVFAIACLGVGGIYQCALYGVV